MTEDLENVDQGVSPVSEAPVEPVNDMLDKNTVSKIVERERLKAFEKGKQEALMELQQQQAAPQEQAPVAQQQQAPQQLGGMQQMSSADIERMIAEKAPQMLQDHVNQLKNEHVVNSFVNKMQAAEAKYPGLETRLADLEYTPSMAKIISMANDVENTADVMNELLNHPSKLFDLLGGVKEQPKLAMRRIMDLSNSIKTNTDAEAQEKQARDPMNQLKPSMNAGMDNNSMASLSVKDLQKMLSSR